MVKLAVRAERCQRWSLCLVSWWSGGIELMSSLFFFSLSLSCQSTTSTLYCWCQLYCDESVLISQSHKWNKSCDQWLWVIMPSVGWWCGRSVFSQGTFCTFDCLSVHVICKRLTLSVWECTRHMALVQPPHTHRHQTLNWMQVNNEKKKDCTHWDSIYTVALSKYTQNKLE